jgi:hypothetical protein
MPAFKKGIKPFFQIVYMDIGILKRTLFQEKIPKSRKF